MGRLRERGLMPMSDVKDRVKDILAEECAVDRASLTDEARLEDVGISSVDMVQVIFAIEEEFGVTIGDGDIGLEIETVGEVTDAVAKVITDAKAGA
jgi:acyl carrier protein